MPSDPTCPSALGARHPHPRLPGALWPVSPRSHLYTYSDVRGGKPPLHLTEPATGAVTSSLGKDGTAGPGPRCLSAFAGSAHRRVPDASPARTATWRCLPALPPACQATPASLTAEPLWPASPRSPGTPTSPCTRSGGGGQGSAGSVDLGRGGGRGRGDTYRDARLSRGSGLTQLPGSALHEREPPECALVPPSGARTPPPPPPPARRRSHVPVLPSRPWTLLVRGGPAHVRGPGCEPVAEHPQSGAPPAQTPTRGRAGEDPRPRAPTGVAPAPPREAHTLTGSPLGPFSPGAPLRPASPCGRSGDRVLRPGRPNPRRPLLPCRPDTNLLAIESGHAVPPVLARHTLGMGGDMRPGARRVSRHPTLPPQAGVSVPAGRGGRKTPPSASARGFHHAHSQVLLRPVLQMRRQRLGGWDVGLPDPTLWTDVGTESTAQCWETSRRASFQRRSPGACPRLRGLGLGGAEQGTGRCGCPRTLRMPHTCAHRSTQPTLLSPAADALPPPHGRGCPEHVAPCPAQPLVGGSGRRQQRSAK